MLAGEPVAELVDGAQPQKQNPEYPNVVSALVSEIVQGRSILLDSIPIARQQVNRDHKYKERKNHKAFGKQPAEVAIELREGFVRVPGFEADVEHAGLVDAALPLIADTFEH